MKIWPGGFLGTRWFVLRLAVVLLTGCGSDIQPAKHLVCELPDGFLSGLDQRDRTFQYYLGLRLRLNGTRYAYIHHLNDTLSVLKTNGMEAKGYFRTWRTEPGCVVTNVNMPHRIPEPYLRADSDGSLTTFIFADTLNKRHVYIDGRAADTSLYKSYIPVIRNGIPAVDSSIYKQTKKTYHPVTDERGYAYLRQEQTTNFYFKGQKGPDFWRITSEEINPDRNRYWYSGELYLAGSPQQELNIPVINGKALWKNPLADYGYIRESEFGDLCFPFNDTLRKKQGYWINDRATPARFDRVGDILFHGKNAYEYVGMDKVSSPDSSATRWAYYLVSNNRMHGPYKYVGLSNRFVYRHYEALPPARKVVMTDDSVFCYQDDRLVYQNQFSHAEGVTSAHFDFLPKTGSTILRVGSEGRAGSFFCVNNDCFPEQKSLPAQENAYYQWQPLHKYLGVSSNGTQYARIEYVYPEDPADYHRTVRLYVNDSLAGTFPYDLELFWDHNDGYLLKGKFGSFRHAFLYQSNADSAEYQQFVAKHYPDGVPEKLLRVRQQEDEIEFGTVEGKIPYVYLENHFQILGERIHAWKYNTQMGVTDNDHFYHLLKNVPRMEDALYVNFELVYSSPEVFGLTDAQNYVSFYSLEGNKLYLVTLDLNSWWARLRHFFKS